MAERRIITFVCSALYEVAIYERLRPALERQGWRMVIVSHLFSVWWKARRLGVACTLARRPRRRDCPALPIGASAEERLGLVSTAQARDFQHGFWEALEESAARHPPDIIAQWNGQNLGGQVASLFARTKGVRTLYFELGNIEPKLFVDRQGVNAAAELAETPEMLDALAPDDAAIEAWREALVSRRRRMTTVPQAKGLLRLNIWFLIDKAARILMRAPWPRRQSILDRLDEKRALALRKPWPMIRPDRPYIFLPLQVSKDTNLVLFSDVDNVGALEIASERARDKGLRLVVKAHPAETDARLLKTIETRCASLGCLMTSLNTTELVEGAQEVVTINSTVGMEAVLLGKPVTLLGRSLYARMTPRQIAALVMRRLVDISPFDTAPAKDEAVAALLAVAYPEAQRSHSAPGSSGGAK